MIPAWTLAMMESGEAWSPLNLGSKLKAWWAPPDGGNITLNGSAIASWADEIGGLALAQVTAGSQPLHAPTGLAGQPCAEFDGTDDYLALAPVPAAVPTGSTYSEIWALVRQDTPGSDSLSRALLGVGSASSGSRRQVGRSAVDAVSRVGVASSGAGSVNAAVDFSGVCVTRSVFDASGVRGDINGVAGPGAAVTHATGTTRLVLGINTALTGGLWLGAIGQVLVTEPLSTAEAAAMYAYLNP